MERWGPYAKIGPPLRTPADNAALWRALAGGLISTVASDHVVGRPELKEPGWQNIFRTEAGQTISSGAPGTETMLPLLFSEGVIRRGYPLSWLARISSENPARLFGLYPRKGVIQAGSDADLTIIDPSRIVTLCGKEMHGKAGFSLYEGREITGWPWTTLARGHVILEGDQVRAEPGTGRFLPRGTLTAPIAGLPIAKDRNPANSHELSISNGR